jgi:DNA-binding phage protein
MCIRDRSGEGNPSFATILKVTNALGIQLHAQSAHS